MGVAEDRTPILVGCADITDLTTPIEQGRSPFDLIAAAAKKAETEIPRSRPRAATLRRPASTEQNRVME